MQVIAPEAERIEALLVERIEQGIALLLSPLGALAIKGFGEREVFALEDEVRGEN